MCISCVLEISRVLRGHVSEVFDFWLQKMLTSPKLQQHGTCSVKMKTIAMTKTRTTMMMMMTMRKIVPVAMMIVGQRLY